MFKGFPNDVRYKVVINHEEQYSIWPADREDPAGWRSVPPPEVEGFADLPGPVGSKAEVTRYIEEVWTDMRPLSLHDDMAKLVRESLH